MTRRDRPRSEGNGLPLARRDVSIELYEPAPGRARLEGSLLSAGHFISLRLEVDASRARVLGAAAGMETHPCRRCPRALRGAARLRGLPVGWESIDEVSRRLGGPDGCIHLRELGRSMMAMAAEALVGYREGFGLMGSRDREVYREIHRNLVGRRWAGLCVAYPAAEGDVCAECLECPHPCGRGERRRAGGVMKS